MCKSGQLVSHFYWIREIEDVKGFLKLLRKVPFMKNNISYKFFSDNPEIEDIMLTNYMLVK